MEIEAPAKINLFLRVLGRRPDGFHEIDTLMVPISLSDRLVIRPMDEPGVRFSCDDKSLPTDRQNLVVRAAEDFLAESGVESGVEIELHKRIPHGAGLGGGSSDAATTLLALNRIFHGVLTDDVIHALAARLGSDVPFFLVRGPAFCRGRGEHVVPAPFSARIPLLLVKPPFGVPTPWAYRRWKEAVEIPGIEYGPQSFDWGEMVNDLERPVFEKFIFLAALKHWLRAQPEVAGALLSGSGSTVLAVLRDEAVGETLAVRVREVFGETMWTACCSNADTSSLG